MFVIPSEYERETTTVGTHAIRHSIAVAFANYGGASGGLASAGRCTIWSDRGAPLAQLEARGLGVAVAIEGHGAWRARGIMLASP